MQTATQEVVTPPVVASRSQVARTTAQRKHDWQKKAKSYLGPLLPTGWANYFEARRAGKYFGLTIECPVCGTTPPDNMKYGSRRWRWLSVHLAEHKAGR